MPIPSGQIENFVDSHGREIVLFDGVILANSLLMSPGEFGEF
jgi:hypothetical protein